MAAEREYNDLYALVTGEDQPKNSFTRHSDVYQELMKKEGRVLDTIHRVVEQKERFQQEPGILDQPLRMIFVRTMRTLLEVIRDGRELQQTGTPITFARVLRILTVKRRSRYLGIFLIVVSLLLLLLLFT